MCSSTTVTRPARTPPARNVRTEMVATTGAAGAAGEAGTATTDKVVGALSPTPLPLEEGGVAVGESMAAVMEADAEVVRGLMVGDGVAAGVTKEGVAGEGVQKGVLSERVSAEAGLTSATFLSSTTADAASPSETALKPEDGAFLTAA